MIPWIEKIPCVSWRSGLIRLMIFAAIVYAVVLAYQAAAWFFGFGS